MINNPFKPIQSLSEQLESEEFLIEEERQDLLSEIAHIIADRISEEKQTNVLVICTHNSRRSQLGEIWLRVAADYYELPLLYAYSGGTEATAFNPRMIKALSRKGFQVYQKSNSSNPQYALHWKHNQDTPQVMFSKKYDDTFNPREGLIALLVCDQADQECPVVSGAEARFAVGYEDPKHADDTLDEDRVYDSKVIEIGREMYYLIRIVKGIIESKK